MRLWHLLDASEHLMDITSERPLLIQGTHVVCHLHFHWILEKSRYWQFSS